MSNDDVVLSWRMNVKHPTSLEDNLVEPITEAVDDATSRVIPVPPAKVIMVVALVVAL